MQSLGSHVACNHGLQFGLIDGYLTPLQTLYLCVVDIHTRNINAHLGEAGSRYEPDISCSYDCYIHVCLLFTLCGACNTHKDKIFLGVGANILLFFAVRAVVVEKIGEFAFRFFVHTFCCG